MLSYRRSNWQDLVIEKTRPTGQIYLEYLEDDPGSLFRTRVEMIDVQACAVRASGWFDHPSIGYFLLHDEGETQRLRAWHTVRLESPSLRYGTSERLGDTRDRVRAVSHDSREYGNQTRYGAGAGLRAKSVQSNRGRLVFPATAVIHTRGVSRLLGSLNEADAVRGFPNGFPLKRRITISLAVDWSNPTADARSRPAEALIVLPLSRALAWDDGKLRRIVRHELAHVGLAAYVEYRTIPRWFDEGFAEWASGGLTCEGRWRIWIEAQRRGEMGVAWPQPSLTGSGLGDRLAYDMYSTFVEYLDIAWVGGCVEWSPVEQCKGAWVGRGVP